MSFMAILLFFLVFANVLIVSNQRRQHMESMVKNLEIQGDLIGTFIREPLLKHDYANVEQFVLQWAEEHDEVLEMTVSMPNGFMLVEYKSKRASSHTLDIQREIHFGENLLSTLTMTLDSTNEEKIISDLQLQLIIGSIILTCALGAALWLSLKRMALTPLEREVAVRKQAEEMLVKGKVDLEARVAERTKELSDSNISLLAEIEERGRMEEDLKSSDKKLSKSRERFAIVLDSIAAIVYVADMQTHELLYVNQYARDLFGDVEGRKCWQTIQSDQTGPCAFCTNDQLLNPDGTPKGIYHWTFQNTANGAWYDIRDRAIEWIDGRIVRMEIAYDITERKKVEKELKKERDRAQHFLDIAGVIIVSLKADQRVALINTKGCEILQYSHEDIVGKNWFDNFLPDSGREEVKGTFSKLMSGSIENVEYYENPVLTKNGEERIIAWHNSLVTNDEGVIVGTLSSGEDITERREKERALRLSEEKFSKAFRSSPTYITISTLQDGRYIDANDAFLKASGYSRKELIGHRAVDLGVWEDSGDRVKLIKQLQEQGAVYNMETRMRIKSGETIDVLYSAEQIEIGGEPCLLAVKLDISERKQLELQLQHAQKMEAVGQLAGGVAHDFNNILTAIISNGFLLRNRSSEGDPSRDFADNIITLSNNAAKIVRELLLFSRKQEPKMLSINLNDVIRNSARLLSDFIGKEVTVVTEPTERDLPIMADRHQLEQVVVNLATNARDAMPGGGRLNLKTEVVTIDERHMKRHGLSSPGSYALLTVSDTGTGIKKETRGKMFEPFFTTKEVGKGTGLGLSIIYGIVKQHKGFIDVCSEDGKGTDIEIYIPLAGSPVE